MSEISPPETACKERQDASRRTRARLLSDLTRRIRSIERIDAGLPTGVSAECVSREVEGGSVPTPSSPAPPPSPLGFSTRSAPEPVRAAWRLFDDGAAAELAPTGLDRASTYELKPVSAPRPILPARYAAAQTFAVRMAASAVHPDAARCGVSGPAPVGPPVLWCLGAAAAGEIGRPSGHGLAALGLDPDRLIVVTGSRAQDVLWAAEEGLKSESLALVVVLLDEVGLTPARRLALAAAAHATPCLLLTHPEAAAAASVRYRWRIAPAPSAPHPADTKAPGTPRAQMTLERARGAPAAASRSCLLEWSDATFRFRLAAALADRPLAEDRAWRRAG